MHEHPKKSFLFLVYFQNQKFFDHTIFSPPLWLLFLKKTKEEEEEEEEKKRKKKLQISSLAVSYSIHTQIKNLLREEGAKQKEEELH
jgi:hypothetical protein